VQADRKRENKQHNTPKPRREDKIVRRSQKSDERTSELEEEVNSKKNKNKKEQGKKGTHMG
jgi:hypothetical protein